MICRDKKILTTNFDFEQKRRFFFTSKKKTPALTSENINSNKIG